MGSRALRRHHRIRIKKKRLYQLKSNFSDWKEIVYLKRLNFSIDTPKACSCYLCGNPRKYWNEKTRKEVISEKCFNRDLNGASI